MIPGRAERFNTGRSDPGGSSCERGGLGCMVWRHTAPVAFFQDLVDGKLIGGLFAVRQVETAVKL